MRYLALLVLVPLLGGCAGQDVVQPLGFESSSSATRVADTLVADTPDAESLGDPAAGRICKTTKRPGSNIADTVCYTREEQLARQEASKDKVAELQREQRWRDQVIQEAQMRNRYPAGLGPR
ncbi:MAG TPA: hypothetical protein VM692_11355 [Gammaproteobacteria bacterium]|nr:hypothetical protein [Gammaproteobacteria bacterium]